MEHSNLSKFLLALDSLSIYRGLLDDKVFSKLKALLISLSKADVELREVINSYHDFYFELAKGGTMSLKAYVLDQLIFDENPFTFQQQASQINRSIPVIRKAAAQDLNRLQLISQLDPAIVKAHLSQLFNSDPNINLIEELPEWVLESHNVSLSDHIHHIKEHIDACNHWQESLEELEKFHKRYGCGLFVRYFAFVWERVHGLGSIRGIDSPDPITLDELVEYQSERSKVIENTLQFLQGFPANNVLLYGDRGTGKSSTVKAILNQYYTQGLRMLEVPKAYLGDFPLIIRQSNNRDEEVHAGDTMQEKLSLADRFGINVVFSSPNQNRYLEIVKGIAARRNLNIDQERLQKEALQWALWYNGRSARTARQFVDWLEGQINLKGE